jgi:hypothetical protein
VYQCRLCRYYHLYHLSEVGVNDYQQILHNVTTTQIIINEYNQYLQSPASAVFNTLDGKSIESSIHVFLEWPEVLSRSLQRQLVLSMSSAKVVEGPHGCIVRSRMVAKKEDYDYILENNVHSRIREPQNEFCTLHIFFESNRIESNLIESNRPLIRFDSK